MIISPSRWLELPIPVDAYDRLLAPAFATKSFTVVVPEATGTAMIRLCAATRPIGSKSLGAYGNLA